MIKRYIGILLSALVFFSCVNEKEVETPSSTEEVINADFYFALTLSTPEANSSRSTTGEDGGSTNGTQEGLDKENEISYAHIYFFDEDKDTNGKPKGTHLATFTVNEGKPVKSYGNHYDLYAKVEIEEIKKLFAAKSANLYVVANADKDPVIFTDIPEGKTAEEFLQERTFKITTINGSDTYASPFTTGTPNGRLCPMSNRDFYPIDLPGINFSADVSEGEVANAVLKYFDENYRDESGNKGNLWNISRTKGTLPLERSIARIDYIKHPSSDSKYTLDDDGAPLFHLAKAAGPKGEKVYLKLKGMQLFNVSKEAFTFRHTSKGSLTSGLETEETKGGIFDHENANSNHGTTPEGEDDETDRTSYRWVYDTDWSTKVSSNINDEGLTIRTSNYFLNQSEATPVTGEDGSVEVTSWGITEEEGKTPNGYISYSDLLKNQGLASNNRGYIPWHYVMENTLPSTQMMGIPFSTGVAFYMEVILKDNENMEVDVIDIYDPITNHLRITMTEEAGDLKDYYQDPEWITEGEGGYYRLTYRYLIEHNNEKDGTVSGSSGNKGDNLAPMQIGIVRNNIYQLAINSISNLPQPHEPDNGYISVSINILSWAFEEREIEL